MLVVEDHEREGAASLTNMSRIAQSESPTMAGWVNGSARRCSWGRALKIVYDVVLYATIRNVRPRS